MKRKKRIVGFVLLLIVLTSAHVVQAGGADVLVARGIEKISARDYEGAVELLAAAVEMVPDDAEANFYLGFSYVRLGRYEEAEKYLLETTRLDPREAEACFELGLLYSYSSQCEQAERYFAKFSEMSADAEKKQSVEDLVQGCRDGTTEDKRFALQVSGGGQYDNNVILEPSFPAVPPEESVADFRGVLFLSADVVAVKSEWAKIDLDYAFYQSVHAELNGFNVTYNRVTPGIEIRVWDLVVPTFGYAFEHTFLDGDAYSLVHEGYGSVLVKEGERFESEVLWAYQNHTLRDIALFDNNSARSGYRNTVELKQQLLLKDMEFSLFGLGEFERDADAKWSYNSYSVGGVIASRIWVLDVEFGGSFVERRYRGSYQGVKRLDRAREFSVVVTYVISKRFGATLCNVTTLNDSNLSDYKYTRNMCGIFLTVEIL